MKDLVFCSRCRGMEVGWNFPYLRHSLRCAPRPVRLFPVAAMTMACLLVAILVPTGAMAPVRSNQETPNRVEIPDVADEPEAPNPDAATVAAIEDLLGRHSSVSTAERLRIARAVVASASRQNVDPFLVTGVLIAESSGNPYAISNRQAVGIMQIHVPTWGPTAEAEGLNLFLVEDNIDLGTRILKDYTRRYGLWEGVLRYLGANESTPDSMAYLERVRGVYSDRQAD